MYPRQQLDVLALRKAVVQSRIAARRQDCAMHAANFTRPVRWFDEVYELCRSVAPRAKQLAIPLGLLLLRRFAKRGGRLAQIVSYATLAMQLAKNFMPQPRRERTNEPAHASATRPAGR